MQTTMKYYTAIGIKEIQQVNAHLNERNGHAQNALKSDVVN